MMERLLPHWHLLRTGAGIDKLIAWLNGDKKKIAVFHNMTCFHPTRTRFNKSKIRLSGGGRPFCSAEVNQKLKELYNIGPMNALSFGTVKLDKNHVNPYMVENTIYSIYLFRERFLLFARNTAVFIFKHTAGVLFAMAKRLFIGQKK